MIALAAESERAADDDRPVPPRKLELVHRLRVEVRRVEALAHSALACEREHVGRDVAAVDVDAGVQVGHEQPPRPTCGVESRRPDSTNDRK